MATNNQLKNIVRKGRISSVDGVGCRAKVVFEDCDDLVSDWLPVLQPFTGASKGYYIPEVGTPVVCLFQMTPSGAGLSDGCILGAYYDSGSQPAESDPDVRSVRFPDGSYIKYDHGNLTVHATGAVVITGATVSIN